MSVPRPIRAVVFDLDGTLIDSEALVREAYFHASRQFSVAMTDEQFNALVGLDQQANDTQLRAHFGVDFPLPDFYAVARAHVGERIAPLKPGALELMDTLDAQATPYALATSSRRPWVDRHFATYKLAARFDAVISREDYATPKPHPDPYLKAAAALGVAPRDALALEDSYAGVSAAHAAGLMTIRFPTCSRPTTRCAPKASTSSHLCMTFRPCSACR